jgi:hypothetical protein
MKYGDIISLFQLGVALNLGFGALVSFVEPSKKRRDSTIYMIESQLLILAERQKNDEPNAAEIRDVFAISKEYRKLYIPSIFTLLEVYFWEKVVTRALFLVCALGAFIGLVICYGFADSYGYNIIVFAVLMNIPPLIIGVLLVFISFWYTYRIFPVLDDLEGRLFKYRLFFDKSTR